MGEAYGTIVAIILGVYLMFIAPVNNMLYENQRLEQIYILNEVTYFVEAVRNTGIITEEMYLELKDRIGALNGSYNLNIIHYKNIYDETEGSVLFFEEAGYIEEIQEELQKNGVYSMEKNEYIKVMVNSGAQMTACHGGSIKNENK